MRRRSRSTGRRWRSVGRLWAKGIRITPFGSTTSPPFWPNTGRHEEAEPLYRQALEVFRAGLGDDHARTRRIAGNYARLLRARFRTARRWPSCARRSERISGSPDPGGPGCGHAGESPPEINSSPTRRVALALALSAFDFLDREAGEQRPHLRQLSRQLTSRSGAWRCE